MGPFRPTPQQAEILRHECNRHGVILAGPGTGKSATVVAYIEQLTREEEPPRVRLLTFTRAATSELALKVSEHPSIVSERPSTIHSFAISVLLRNPGAADFPIPLRMADDWEDDQLVRPTLAARAGVNVRMLDRLMHEMEANWQSLRPQDDPRIDPTVRTRFLGAWNEHRRVYGYTLLSELPSLLRQALADHDDLRGLDYELLVVDEYQDLNACDLEILRRLGERGCAILAAGDDDQSIYSFRKAAPEGIRRFPHDYAESASYPLSISKRCGRRIIGWARFVIEGDPDRPTRPPLTPDDGAADGEVALLRFDNNDAEALGVTRLIQRLIQVDRVPAGEILVLFRGDRYGLFSGPIKEHLAQMGIAVSDPEVVNRALAEPQNRQSLEILRLALNPTDSLAWAGLLKLAPGIGDTFVSYIYDRARANRLSFGTVFDQEHERRFEGAPKPAAGRVLALAIAVRNWIRAHPLPEERPADGWGHWVAGIAQDDVFPGFSEELAEILQDLDALIEAPEDFGRFLNQIAPAGKDLAASKSGGVRFMTMAASKGLTVQATIIAAVEEGIIPRPEAEIAEERRLLYVAMTRARNHLFCTWARRRHGPTARAGAPNVGNYRSHSSFLRGGPVVSQDGDAYLT
jgi:DNA helicase-2/ATP-dependent DNA helicase PcrA